MKSPDVICHWFLQFMHHWFSILFVYEANCRHSASLDVAEAFSCFSLSAVFHGKMNVSNVCLDTQAWIMCQCRVCWLVCLVNHVCAKWSTKKLPKGWVWKYCRICIKVMFHEMRSGLQNNRYPNLIFYHHINIKSRSTASTRLSDTQTPCWTDNDSSLLFAALGKAEPLISTAARRVIGQTVQLWDWWLTDGQTAVTKYIISLASRVDKDYESLGHDCCKHWVWIICSWDNSPKKELKSFQILQ